MLLLLTYVLVQTATPAAPRPESPIVAAALASERRFFDEWERHWRVSESERRKTYYKLDSAALKRILATNGGCSSMLRRCGEPDGGFYIQPGPANDPDMFDPRRRDVRCAFGIHAAMYVSDHTWGIETEKRRIASTANDRHWVCPNWLPPADYYLTGPKLPDERLGIDAALEPQYRQRMRALRSNLTKEMSVAVQRAPRENVLVGQLVRLLTDNGDFDGALLAAEECLADAWWCHALRGYVHHRRGETRNSDEAFSESMTALESSRRCEWADIGPILDSGARTTRAAATCAGRDSLDESVWWLADPLWSVPGNDRRTEQFARRVLIALHAATGRDERYNWTAFGGGDALAEMVSRYGWMSYAYAGDPVQFPAPGEPDYGTSQLFRPRPGGPLPPDPMASARALGGVKTTYEYTIGRVHVIPPWSILSDPFSAKNSDWLMNAPGGESDYTMGWWPQEHYAPQYPLIAIPDQQTAFLRRERATLFAYATNLAQTDLARRIGDSVDVSLLASTDPRSVDVIGESRVQAHDRVTFLGPLPAGPSLVSMEIPWDGTGNRGARSRFGVRPPPPLAAMTRGATAISDPVLLIVPPNLAELPLGADSAIALMRGSTTLSPATNAIGVYWETYGFAATDSVEITVSVRRRTETGAGGVAANPNSAVSTSWNEPQPSRPALTIAGTVPIQMRSVVLRLGALVAGEYALEVSVLKRGAAPVRGTREFTVR